MPSIPKYFSLAIVAIVVAALGCASDGVAAAGAETAPEPTKTLPTAPNDPALAPIEFYLAHGEADACGRNCDEWIVADGKIDVGAAGRLRALLVKLGNRRPPIYFHSAGGSVEGSIALGRLIREKKLQVSVAHTIAPGCSRDKPADSTCESRKRAGQPIEAAFDPTIAMCNSGCVYALAGGAVRLVPPWVKLGIHDVGLDPKASVPRGLALTVAERLAHEHIHDYLHAMGIDVALLTAATAIPNKTVKPLQRSELIRFGIDRREFGETAWQLFEKPRPAIRKQFFVRTDDDPPNYVNALISIDCGNGVAMHLAFAREHLASDTVITSPGPATNISIGGKPIGFYRTSTANFYVRSAQAASNAFDAVGDDATIELPGAELGRKEGPAGNVKLDMEGFSAAYGKLRKACPEAGRISARLVQSLQKYNPIGGSKPPAGNVWPNVQRPAIAQNEPPAPAKAPQKLELARVAAAEQKLRLDFLYAIQPDCSSLGEVVVRVTEQPQHGTLTVEDGQAFTNFPKDNQRYGCNTRKSDGKLIFYQPGADYRGADSLSVYVIYPLGYGQTRHYSIDVK